MTRMCWATWLVLLMMGCAASSIPVENVRLTKLSTYYGRYIASHQGKTPPNEAEFKKYIATIDAEAKLDELFVSPRDSEPFVVRYGMKTATPGATVAYIHEKTGVGGKRMVGLSTGEVRTVDETEFQQLTK